MLTWAQKLEDKRGRGKDRTESRMDTWIKAALHNTARYSGPYYVMQLFLYRENTE